MIASICQKIQHYTKAQHQDLEAHLKLMDSGVTLNCYQEYLKNLYGFYMPIEQYFTIKFAKNCEINALHIQKSEWLAADLLAFNIQLDNLPICQLLPEIQHWSQVLGIAYVLEGATLGGRVILKHLRKNLPELDKIECNYLMSYGIELNQHWQHFKSQLALYCLSHPAEETLIVNSAIDTFKCLSDWLAQPH